MKKVFHFLVIGCFNSVLWLYHRVVYAQESFFASSQRTLYGSQFDTAGVMVTRLGVAAAIAVGIDSLLSLFRRFCFNYVAIWPKLKAKDIIVITYIKNGKKIKQKVQVVAANDKSISFKIGENVYKCSANNIRDIQKHYILNKVFVILFAIIVVLFIMKLIARIYSEDSLGTYDEWD